jgi:hypothetical protein
MSTDMTPTGDDVARPDDVVAEMVKVMRERHPELLEIPAADLERALAEVLPVYGAMVQVRTFGHDYPATNRAVASNLRARAHREGRQ